MENTQEVSKHRCAVRQLCKYRHQWGLSKFRKYISDSPNLHQYLNDFVDQYKKGNRGIGWI